MKTATEGIQPLLMELVNALVSSRLVLVVSDDLVAAAVLAVVLDRLLAHPTAPRGAISTPRAPRLIH